MSDQDWYSGLLRFVFLNADRGKVMRNDCVFLVRAESFDDAFAKLVARGSTCAVTRRAPGTGLP